MDLLRFRARTIVRGSRAAEPERATLVVEALKALGDRSAATPRVFLVKLGHALLDSTDDVADDPGVSGAADDVLRHSLALPPHEDVASRATHGCAFSTWESREPDHVCLKRHHPRGDRRRETRSPLPSLGNELFDSRIP